MTAISQISFDSCVLYSLL